ncbi:MAG: ion channel [Acidiferrobacteraceae bacterium]
MNEARTGRTKTARHRRALSDSDTVRVGHEPFYWRDLYHLLLTIGWGRFLGLISAVYTGINVLFAWAYLAVPGTIAHARPGSLWDTFFFSVQTMATIGYGNLHPATLYGNILMTLESFIGLLGLAIATGLVFVRFSRPAARILFSRFMVVTLHDGRQTLMFRTANQRYNRILEARVQVTLVRNEHTLEGRPMRRFHDLTLLRSQSPVFSLSWSILHPIDRESPLYGFTAEDLERSRAEIIVIVTGIDDTLSQIVHARHTYTPADIQWGRRFHDIVSETPDGKRLIDYSRFHDLADDTPGR